MRCVLLFVLILVSNTGWASSGIVVRAYSKVQEVKPITLVDISDTRNISEQQRERLEKIVIGQGPKQGEQVQFSSDQIARSIRMGLPKGASMPMKIPTKIVVENRGYELTKEAITESLSQKWKADCASCRYIIHNVSLPIVGKERMGQKWRIVEPVRKPKTTFSVQVAIGSTAGDEQYFWVTGRLEVQRQVPVAVRAMPIGYQLKKEDMRFDFKDVTLATDSAPESEGQLAGMALRRAVAVGDILWHGSLVRPKALRRGQTVKVTSGSKDWQVTILGVAEQDAYVGEVVRIKNPQSKKIFLAEVLGPNEVVVK